MSKRHLISEATIKAIRDDNTYHVVCFDRVTGKRRVLISSCTIVSAMSEVVKNQARSEVLVIHQAECPGRLPDGSLSWDRADYVKHLVQS